MGISVNQNQALIPCGVANSHCSLISTNLGLLSDLWSHQVLQMEKYSFQIPNVFPTVNKILFKCQKQLLWFTLILLTMEAHFSTSKAKQQPSGITAARILTDTLTLSFKGIRNSFLKIAIYVNCTLKIRYFTQKYLIWEAKQPPTPTLELNKQITQVTCLARCLNSQRKGTIPSSLEHAI